MERPSRRDHIQCLVLQNQRTRDEYLASAPAIIPVAQQENIVPPPTMEQVQEQLANIPIPPIYHPITTPKPKHIPKNDSISLEKKQKLVQIYNRDLINGVRRNKQYYLELSSRLTIKVNSIKYLLSKIKGGNHFEVEKQKGRKPLVTTEHLKTVGEFVINPYQTVSFFDSLSSALQIYSIQLYVYKYSPISTIFHSPPVRACS
ncbi:Hypothetical_protein [Hexamita inflata]|uniref:Hypothetical_protein n=1 Tax=Hexamita inflata TaxID=28002 RepID=A0AA86PD25_9EUKA|nr:Hypothetical protein HINF_LOCUS23201 [Hexamita inflata]